METSSELRQNEQSLGNEVAHWGETVLTSEDSQTWALAFIGIIAYVIVEYTRLPAMFPILIPLQVGKLVIALSLVGLVLLPSRQAAEQSTSLYAAMAVFLFFVVISCLFAEFPAPAWNFLPNVVQWVVILVLISKIVNTPKRLRIFIVVFILLNMKLGQHAVRDYASLRALGDSTEILSARGVGAGSQGFFGNPGDFGVAMAVIWPLAGSLAFGEPRRLTRWILVFCWLVFLAAIILCGSRGALLAAGVATVIALIKSPSRKGGLIVAIIFVAGLALLLPQANVDRFKSGMSPEKDATAQIRLRLWRAGAAMFEDHFAFGVGLDNFRPMFHAKFANGERFAWAPHSIYVEALSELGILGTVPLIASCIICFRLNSRTRKRVLSLAGARHSFEFRLAAGLDLALISYLVSGAFLTVLYYPHLWIIQGLTAGLFTAAQRANSATSGNKNEVHRTATPTLASSCL